MNTYKIQMHDYRSERLSPKRHDETSSMTIQIEINCMYTSTRWQNLAKMKRTNNAELLYS